MSDFFTEVTPRIVQGHEVCSTTQADGEDWTAERKAEKLRELGITHVLNLHDNRALDGFSYHFAPMVDDKRPDKPIEWFKDCLDFALPVLEQDGTRLYIHCVAGVARSSAITYAILRAQSRTIQEAFCAPAQRPGFEIIYLSAAEYAVRNLGFRL